jgi:acetyltransferase-like isoleucine patch superfamily enzyme
MRIIIPILNRAFIVLLAIPAYTYLQVRYSLRYAWEYLVGYFMLQKLSHRGRECCIHGDGRITDLKKMKIGNYVRVGENYYFHTEGGLEIGDGSVLSRNVSIYTANHKLTADCLPFGSAYEMRKVVIGRGVWVGMNVNILPGVTIGDGAIIGMGATVAEDVPEGAIYVGAKGRIAKVRASTGWQKSLESSSFFGRREK